MRRIVRAILEAQSYRDELSFDPASWYAVGLLNASIAGLQQVEALVPIVAPLNPRIDPKVDHVSEIIRQVNTEIHDDAARENVEVHEP